MSFSPDTSPEARSMVFAALRRSSPGRRLELAITQSEFVRQLVLAGVRRDFPDLAEDQRHAKFLERWLGEDLGARAAAWRSTRQAPSRER